MDEMNEHAERITMQPFSGSTLVEMWNDFAGQCLPDDAPAYQLLHMRQAFIAGATCYRLAFGVAVRDGGDDIDAQSAHVESLDKQLADMCGQLVKDVTGEFEAAFDAALPDEPKHKVRFVDGRNLTPSQIEELDSVITATVERFEAANAQAGSEQ